MSKKSSKYQETSSIANNFSKYSLIFAFSIILAENKYIFTYLIRISIKMTQNKYTYQKKVSRRNPVKGLDLWIQSERIQKQMNTYVNTLSVSTEAKDTLPSARFLC